VAKFFQIELDIDISIFEELSYGISLTLLIAICKFLTVEFLLDFPKVGTPTY
jgi:hypothetical protein